MLNASDIWFGYDERTPVLRGVSLAIPDGGIVGILGPNGSGKTTLLRLLAGTRHPQRGTITLNGAPLGRFSRAALARRMAVVPQETHLAFDYTVAEVAMMGRYPHLGAFEIEGPADIEIVEAALAATGTLGLKDRPFGTLSGGEKQRVVIASALAQISRDRRIVGDAGIFRLKAEATKSQVAEAPESQAGVGEAPDSREGVADETVSGILLLDEPTDSLDLAYQLEIAVLLNDLQARRRVSIVISTHDLSLAASLCEQIVLIRSGAIIAAGLTDDVLTPAHVQDAYGVDAEIVRHPSGYRAVVPIRRTRPRSDV